MNTKNVGKRKTTRVKDNLQKQYEELKEYLNFLEADHAKLRLELEYTDFLFKTALAALTFYANEGGYTHTYKMATPVTHWSDHEIKVDQAVVMKDRGKIARGVFDFSQIKLEDWPSIRGKVLQTREKDGDSNANGGQSGKGG